MKLDKDKMTQIHRVSMKKLARMHSRSEGYQNISHILNVGISGNIPWIIVGLIKHCY